MSEVGEQECVSTGRTASSGLGSGGGRSGSVDLQQVEGCGGEVDLGGGCGQSASAEPVDDLLEVADRGFNGGPSPFVAGCALGGAQPVVHRLARAGARRRVAFGGPPAGVVVLAAALAQRRSAGRGRAR